MPKKIYDDQEDDTQTPDVENKSEENKSEASEPDTTPLIQTLALESAHPKGHAEIQTDIRAMIHAPTGFVAKRIVITGGVTAKRLGELLLDVATW